jgi:tetratricopeptide (TPR) repeat protein
VAALVLLAYTLARPGPALVALAGLLLGAGSLSAQRPAAGTRALAAGDPARAAAAFLEEARGATARDTAFYNAGTAALEAGRLDVARGALTEAAKSLDPALRYRALYNLGLASLLAARADTTRSDELLDDAAERLRQALLLEPSSERAKWNLELTERRRPPPPPRGGGGGAPPPTAPPPPQPKNEPPPSQGLSENQAEQILNSMDRRERETRAEQQRRLESGASAGVKDW